MIVSGAELFFIILISMVLAAVIGGFTVWACMTTKGPTVEIEAKNQKKNIDTMT